MFKKNKKINCKKARQMSPSCLNPVLVNPGAVVAHYISLWLTITLD